MTKDFIKGVNAGIGLIRDWFQQNSYRFISSESIKEVSYEEIMKQLQPLKDIEIKENWLLKEYDR